MRIVQVVVASVVAWTGTAAAAPVKTETFGGWRYLAPAKFTVTKAAGHVAFQKLSDQTFCALALFQIRPMSDRLAVESSTEWSNVVENDFTAANVKRGLPSKTKRGIPYHMTSAMVTDGNGDQFAATNYVIAPQGMVGSVLFTSTTAASLKKCEPTAKAFVESLTFDPASMPQADPEETMPSPVGLWAASASTANGVTPQEMARHLGEASASSREYTFDADGTYRFRGELRGGRLKPGEWSDLRETGTYTLAGNQLTLIPKAATRTLRREPGVAKVSKPRLERVTYTWSKQYASGTSSWTLLLTPPAKTARDGEFDVRARLDASYAYSDAHTPTWTVPSALEPVE